MFSTAINLPENRRKTKEDEPHDEEKGNGNDDCTWIVRRIHNQDKDGTHQTLITPMLQPIQGLCTDSGAIVGIEVKVGIEDMEVSVLVGDEMDKSLLVVLICADMACLSNVGESV